jgi:hypothetical protein
MGITRLPATIRHAECPAASMSKLSISEASGREVPGKKDWIRRPNQNDTQALNLPGAGGRSVEN